MISLTYMVTAPTRFDDDARSPVGALKPEKWRDRPGANLFCAENHSTRCAC